MYDPIPPERMYLFVELFRRVGYRSPSMLDISQHLGVSKKTLYQYVPNKEELIVHTIHQVSSEYEKKLKIF